MRARSQSAWNQDLKTLMSEDVRDADDVQETARRIVNDDRAMAEIRRTVEEKGLDPIWVQLILEFGTMMYLRGQRSHWPPSSGPR